MAPVPIADAEIAAIQLLENSGLPLERWPYLREGDPMRIEEGLLTASSDASFGQRIATA